MLHLQRSIVPFHARLKFDIAAGVGSSAWEPISCSPLGGASSGSAAPSSGSIAIPGEYPLTPSLGHSQDRESHVTKTEQTLTDSFSRDATDSDRLDPLRPNCTVTVRAFLFQNQEIQVEARVRCALGTDDRISPEVNGRAT